MEGAATRRQARGVARNLDARKLACGAVYAYRAYKTPPYKVGSIAGSVRARANPFRAAHGPGSYALCPCLYVGLVLGGLALAVGLVYKDKLMA